LAGKIPWEEVRNIYTKQAGISHTGRPPLSPRVVIGSLIIKHMCNLDDRETVARIAEICTCNIFWAIPALTLNRRLMHRYL
jgi:IS5 family transposase